MKFILDLYFKLFRVVFNKLPIITNKTGKSNWDWLKLDKNDTFTKVLGAIFFFGLSGFYLIALNYIISNHYDLFDEKFQYVYVNIFEDVMKYTFLTDDEINKIIINRHKENLIIIKNKKKEKEDKEKELLNIRNIIENKDNNIVDDKNKINKKNKNKNKNKNVISTN